jgi:hypothetical protein
MKEIKRRCQFCDEKNEKSINTNIDDYVAIKKGKANVYYHSQCYQIYLMTKKKMSEEESLLEIQRLKAIMEAQMEEIKYRDKLCKLVMDLYDISYLPDSYFIRLTEINNGTYKKIKEPISNMDLYTMYSNQKLIAKLGNIALKKGISKEKRLYWDLAIVLSEYEGYKKWKRNNISKNINIDKIKKEMGKIKQAQQKEIHKKDDEVDITELIL